MLEYFMSLQVHKIVFLFIVNTLLLFYITSSKSIFAVLYFIFCNFLRILF